MLHFHAGENHVQKLRTSLITGDEDVDDLDGNGWTVSSKIPVRRIRIAEREMEGRPLHTQRTRVVVVLVQSKRIPASLGALLASMCTNSWRVSGLMVQALHHAASAGKNALAAMQLLIDFNATLDIQNKKGASRYTPTSVPPVTSLAPTFANALTVPFIAWQGTRRCTSQHNRKRWRLLGSSSRLAQVSIH
eukprot:2088518-Rhodomonas_salina.1